MKTREEKLAYQREYGRTHKEQVRALKRQWITEHPEEWREYCRNKMREAYHRKHPNSRYFKTKYTIVVDNSYGKADNKLEI